MSVKVRFTANIFQGVGEHEVDIDVEEDAAPTAREVLVAVGEAENRDLSGLLRTGQGGSWSAVRVVRNGRVLPSLDVQVADGDVLVLFPLLGAG
jgi:molybdopterin converting factor small subunit